VTRKTLIVAALVTAASMTRCTAKPSPPSPKDQNDDRPPIIVTNGSINFDDGDPNDSKKWKDWTKANGNGNAKQWTQNFPTGSNVASFTVTLAGSSDQSCNTQTPSIAAVAIEYTPTDGSAKSLVVVQPVQWSSGGGKREPWVSAPLDIQPGTTTSGQPPRITYGDTNKPKTGYISYVTLTSSSAPKSCPFLQGGQPVITIQPKVTP
jgi:hypothetical protein